MNDQVRTQVRSMRGVAVSPDGKSVVTSISDTTAEGGENHLWLLAADAPPRQLTFGQPVKAGDRAHGESSPQWLPDGSALLFLANRDGTNRLYRLPLTGGEPVALDFGKSGSDYSGHWAGQDQPDEALVISSYSLSPDGKYLAISATDPKTAAEKARAKNKDDGYSHGEEKDNTHLYLMALGGGVAKRVELAPKLADVNWSYDSADLLVSTDPRSDLTGPDTTIWRVTPDGEAEKLDLPSTVSGAIYLRGRKQIAYTLQCDVDTPPRCNDLWVKDLATGKARNLTHGFDGAIPSRFTLGRDGTLYMVAAMHTQRRLGSISPADGSIKWFDLGLPVVGGFDVNSSQNGWAVELSGPEEPGKIVIASKPGGQLIPLQTPPLVPDDWGKVPSKLVTWQNEGLTIEGMLYMPKVPAGQRVPLVVNVHGGPAGNFADGYSNLVQMLVAEGWAVLQSNPRGSTGYGANFLAANKNDLGGADYRDIMTGVDTVLKNYPLDPDRMALIGYSYGGEMAGFVVGKTDRFKAIVSGAPVIDQFSEYGTERGSYYDRWYYGRPWDNFEDAWRQSPIAYAKNAKTPFLLLQGAEDPTDPLGQSLEMYRALTQYDAPVALLVYPREDHGLLGGNFAGRPSPEPWHGLDVRRRMFGFLRAAFAGEADPLAKARAEGPTREGD